MHGASWDAVAPQGVFQIPAVDAVFLEPCRIISSYYSSFYARPSLYYSRSFFFYPCALERAEEQINERAAHGRQTKAKKKRKRAHSINDKEKLAQQRHQEIRKVIADAHRALLCSQVAASLLESIKGFVVEDEAKKGFDDEAKKRATDAHLDKSGWLDLVQLASVWQAPYYNIALSKVDGLTSYSKGQMFILSDNHLELPLFDQKVENKKDEDLIGTCADFIFLLPRKSAFLISDFKKIWQLIPGDRLDGYNLILIDPPWENKSVHRRNAYQMLPNKHLLSLPLHKLAHPDGALVGLWVTNREKLRSFIESELLPIWGVRHFATWYWLKIKSNGDMVCELDLIHHKPYECLVLGYLAPKSAQTKSSMDLSQGIISSPENAAEWSPLAKLPPDQRVLISIPGDHSRKPPVASLLSPFVPGNSPAKGLELFARDMNPGLTSWGNEPLRFQHLNYFQFKENKAQTLTSHST